MLFPYSDDSPHRAGKPIVNWLLIAINVVIFLICAARPADQYQTLVEYYGFTPGHFVAATLLSSMFMHAGFGHLFGNMWFLYIFGDNVELRIGSGRYLACYLICGVAGDLSHYFFFSNSMIPSIGASGAIFGVMGMYLFLFPFNKIRSYVLFFAMEISAIWVIGMKFVLEAFASSAQVMGTAESGIGHLAHSGGFVAGFILAFFAVLVSPDVGYEYSLLGFFGGKQRQTGYRTVNLPDGSRVIEEVRPGAGMSGYGAPGMYADALPAYADDLSQVAYHLCHSNKDQARQIWRRMAANHPEAVLPPREQLEIALELDKHKFHTDARDAYERLLRFNPDAMPYAPEAALALAGMLLQNAQKTADNSDVPYAKELLERAIAKHPDPERRALAQKWHSMLSMMRTMM